MHILKSIITGMVCLFISTNAAAINRDSVYRSLLKTWLTVEKSEPYYIISLGGLKAIADSNGKPVTAFRYSRVVQVMNQKFFATIPDYYNYNHREEKNWVNIIGWQIPNAIDTVNGLYKFYNYDNVTIYDTGGKLLYKELDNDFFKKGILIDKSKASNFYYRKAQTLGIKDTFNHILLPEKEYKRVTAGNNYFSVLSKDSAFVYTKDGKLMFAQPANDCEIFPGDFITVKLYGLWALLDSAGKNLTPYEFHEMSNYTAGKRHITADGKVMDKKGQFITKNFITHDYRTDGVLSLEADGTDEEAPSVFENFDEIYEHKHLTSIVGSRYLKQNNYEESGRAINFYDIIQKKFVPYKNIHHVKNDIYSYYDYQNGRYDLLYKGNPLNVPPFTNLKIDEVDSFIVLTKDESVLKRMDPNSDERNGNNGLQLNFDLDANEPEILAIVTKEGQVLNDAKFLAMQAQGNKIAFAKNFKGLDVVIDEKGKVLHQFKNRYSVSTFYNIKSAFYNKKHVLLNRKGQLIYNGEYLVKALSFEQYGDYGKNSTTIFLFADQNKKSKKYGLIDTTGRLVQEYLYDTIEQNGERGEILMAHKNMKFQVLNLKGDAVFNGRWFDDSTKKFFIKNRGLFLPLKENNRWGILGYDGEWIRQPQYDSIKLSGQDYDPVKWMAYKGDSIDQLNNAGLVMEKIPVGKINQKAPQPTRRQDLLNQKCLNLKPNEVCQTIKGWVLIADTVKNKLTVKDSSEHKLLDNIELPDQLFSAECGLLAITGNTEILYQWVNNKFIRREINIDSNSAKSFKNNGKVRSYIRSSIERQNPVIICIPLQQWMISFRSRGSKLGFFSPYGPVYEDNIQQIVRQNNWLVKTHNKWGIAGSIHSGEAQSFGWVLPAEYDSIKYDKKLEGYRIYKNGKRGIYHHLALIPADYDSLYINYNSLKEGFIYARIKDKFHVINSVNKRISEDFDSIIYTGFPKGYIAVQKGKEGFVNLQIRNDGQIVAKESSKIKQQNLNVHNEFHLPANDTSTSYKEFKHATLSKENGKYGVYDNNKLTWLLKPIYDTIYVDENSLYIALKNRLVQKRFIVLDTCFLFNENYNLIYTSTRYAINPTISGGLIYLNGHYSTPVINNFGKIIVPDSFSQAMDYQFGEYLHVKVKDTKEGAFDKEGNMIIPPVYDRVNYLENAPFFTATKHGSNKEFLYNNKGKLLSNGVYEEISIVDSYHPVIDKNKPFFVVGNDDLYGLIDENGKQILKCKYSEITQVYHAGLVIAQDEKEKWGIVNFSGKTIAAFQYDKLNWFVNGQAKFERGKLKGYINEKGKEMLSEETKRTLKQKK